LIRRIALLVRKDLLRKRRAPLGIFVVLAFPVVLSGLLALSFGGGGRARLPRIELLVEDLDGSLATRVLLAAAASGPVAEMAHLRRVGTEGVGLLEADEADALLRIPPGFGADLLAGRAVTLELVKNPARSIKPEIVEQALSLITEVLSEAARLMPRALGQQVACLESEDCTLTSAQISATAAAVYESIRGSSDWLSPLAIRLESVSHDREDAGRRSGSSGFSIFLFVLPGVSVWALFMIGDHGMRDVLAESVLGTLRRQLCGPVSVRDVVLGKAALSATLAVIGLSILSAIALLVLEGPVDLPAFAALSAALVLAVTGFSAVIYGAAKTERQGATFSSAALLLLAFLGGSFVPLESMPAVAQRLAPLSPLYWATSGYRALIAQGATTAAIGTHVAVLAVLGIVLLLFGARLLERSIRSGRTA